jgi:FKBP-type peptidyl-prolyl cis-trans isomerase
MIRNFVVGTVFCGCAFFSCSFSGCGKTSQQTGDKKVETAKAVETPAVVEQPIEDHVKAREKSASGLEWEILQEGSGNCPRAGNTVTVHYTGWLNENGQPGKKFDSSVDRGQKFSFRIGVGMVIPGWDEGVMGMKVGEKRRLYIPSNLAYGARGAGNVIPPHAALIFDVELFNVA